MNENKKTPVQHGHGDKDHPHRENIDLKEIQIKTMSLPDLRPDKIKKLKTKVENGTYAISPRKIAERLIEDATIFPPV